jgi:hypothetical protein
MAERLVIISDLSGRSPAARYQIGRPGHGFEIDLTEEEAGEMFSALAAYIPLARPLPEPKEPTRILRSTTADRKPPRRSNDNGQWAKMRAWALGAGMRVSDRGPLPNEVVNAYLQLHPDTVLPTPAADENEAISA